MATRFKWYEIETDEQAKTVIGSIVYESYTPMRVGKIIDCYINNAEAKTIHDIINRGPIATVKWLKQTKTYPDPISDVPLAHLNDYEALMEDHRRKYKNQKALLELVKAL